MTDISTSGRSYFDEPGEETESLSFFRTVKSEFALPPLPHVAPQVAEDVNGLIAKALVGNAPPAERLQDADYGAVLRPQNETLWDYKCALSDAQPSIPFSPKDYKLFDSVIVEICMPIGAEHAAFTVYHARFMRYAPLRRNLAILRNYLMLRYAPSHEENRALLKSMAARLGHALNGEAPKQIGVTEKLTSAMRGMLTGKQSPPPDYNHFLELANTPDRGIAFMYEYIRNQHPKSEAVEPPLQPLESSPFSGENMLLHSDASRMAIIADALEAVAAQTRSVDDMPETEKEISVEHARDILRNMRIIATGKQDEKTVDSIDGRASEARSMLELSLYLEKSLADLAKSDPEVAHEPLLRQASDSLRKIAPRVRNEQEAMAKEERRNEAPPSSTTSQTNRVSPGKQSRSGSKPKNKEPVGLVLSRLDYGINRVAEVRKKSLIKAMKQGSPVSQAIGNFQVFKDGMSTMSGPKIHQVSVNDSDLIQTIKKLNEPPEPDHQKEAGGGPIVPGRR